MNKTALLVLLLAVVSDTASAQSAPLRGAGLLALNSTESLATNPVAKALDMADSGGGSTGARALRGGDANPRTAPTAADAGAPDSGDFGKVVGSGDPSQPAAATPKRPSYRWQSLVPGAIK